MTARASTAGSAGGSRRSAARSQRPLGSHGHRPGPARWPWRCAPGRALDNQLAVGLAGAGLRRRTGTVSGHRDGGSPAGSSQPRVPPKGRWTPAREWPDLPAGCEAGHAPAPSARRPSARRWLLSSAAPRSPFDATQRPRPGAGTCCRFSSVKTLLMPGRNGQFPTGVNINISGGYPIWPVLSKCPDVGVHWGAGRDRAGCSLSPPTHGWRATGSAPSAPPLPARAWPSWEPGPAALARCPSTGDEGRRRHPLRCARQGGCLKEFGIATGPSTAEREVGWPSASVASPWVRSAPGRWT